MAILELNMPKRMHFHPVSLALYAVYLNFLWSDRPIIAQYINTNFKTRKKWGSYTRFFKMCCCKFFSSCGKIGQKNFPEQAPRK